MREVKLQLFLIDALKVMFDVVGEEYTLDYVRQEGWFRNKSWTTAAQENYRRWFEGELKKRFKMRKKHAENEASWFLFNYGWVVEDTNAQKTSV